jgi:hypothetical protein
MMAGNSRSDACKMSALIQANGRFDFTILDK